MDRNNWLRRISNLSQQYINDIFQSLIPYYSSAFDEIKIIRSQAKSIPPIFSLYRPATDSCYIGTSSNETIWKKVAEKLDQFDEHDDLAIFTELAYAHEVGHCIAFKYLASENKAWTLYERELFSDAFAILHIDRWMNEDHDVAFKQLIKLRLGGPPDPERPSPDDIGQLKILLEQTQLEQIAEDDYLYQAEQAMDLVKQLRDVKASASQTQSSKEREEKNSD